MEEREKRIVYLKDEKNRIVEYVVDLYPVGKDGINWLGAQSLIVSPMEDTELVEIRIPDPEWIERTYVVKRKQLKGVL